MTETTRLKIPELSASEKVSEGPTKINSGFGRVDEINWGQQDYLQAGVRESADWRLELEIVESTGVMASEAATGGVAWLPDPEESSRLMRSVTTSARLTGLTASQLPISEKFMVIGVELTPTTWGGAATVSLKSGVEYGSQAEAEAHSPAVTPGNIRIRDVVVKNASTADYSLPNQIDRREYATAKAGPQPGDLRFTARATLEEGWLKCEGQAVSRVTYGMLFAALGTVYGAGNGTTTFNLPNYIERTAIGVGSTRTLGESGGEATVALTTAQLASHTHSVDDPGHTHGVGDPGHTHGVYDPGHAHSVGYLNNNANGSGSSGYTELQGTGYEYASTTNATGIGIDGATTGIGIDGATTGIAIYDTGSGDAHNNMQPYTVCNVWIKT